jgi:hypothetical protein
MNIEELIESAASLPTAGPKSIEAYEAKSSTLAAEVNASLLGREDIDGLVGPANIEMMKDNHSNHAMFVASILKMPDPKILVDTVIWVYRAYRSRGFHPNYWASQIQAWLTAIKNNLTDAQYKDIYPLYNWFIITIPSFTALSEESADDASKLDPGSMH